MRINRGMRGAFLTLAATAVIAGDAFAGFGSAPTRPRRGDRPPNGNSRRKHKENVKRRRLRSISKKQRSLNRK